MKIIAKINEVVNRKTIEKISETRSWFFEKINKINKLLAPWTEDKKNEYPNC